MIYFDSGATTLQKPAAVALAMRKTLQNASSPGRGGYEAANRAAECVFACRSELAEFFHLQNPERVVFTANATHGLNLAVKSLVPPGGRAVISGYEHNAVTRTLYALGADVTVAEGLLFEPEGVLSAFHQAVTPDTDAVICNHVSNVFGFVQPVEALAALCRERGVPLIVDASQSAGLLPLDMEALGAAFIAMPGHKSLYGPQGTGVLLCGAEASVVPLLEGGTGSQSVLQAMPDFLPDRLEAGTPNVPGIAGLLEGVRFVLRQGPANILKRERALAALAAAGLRTLPDTEVFAATAYHAQTGVVSFRCGDRDAETVAEALAEQDIAVRAGYHCAPLAHRTAGTLETGTVRLSFSDFNTREEVWNFLERLECILRTSD